MSRKRKKKPESGSKQPTRGKSRSRLTVLVRRAGLLVLLLGAAIWAAAWFALGDGAGKSGSWAQKRIYRISAQAGFTVQDIVVIGRNRTDLEVLRSLIGIERGDPILSFRPNEAREELKRISWIKDAEVERRLPHTIYIRLTERKPLAVWQNKQKLRLIDAEGVTLGDDLKKGGNGNLLLVVGDDAPKNAAELIGVIDAEPSIRARIDAATRVGARRWDLRLKNGVTVRLPENDAALALRRLAAAQQKDGILDKEIVAIDMRGKDRIVVETKKGVSTSYDPAKGGSNI
jgi:cell division protein FtsQ